MSKGERELELKQDVHQNADNASLKSSQEKKKTPLDYTSLSHIHDATAENRGTQLLKMTV